MKGGGNGSDIVSDKKCSHATGNQWEIRPHRFGGEGVLIGGQQQH